MAKAPTATQADVIRAAVALAARPSVDHLLYVGDLALPEELFRGKPRARKRLVQAVVSENQRDVIEASGVRVLPLPDYDLGRPEKLKIALVSGIARGFFEIKRSAQCSGNGHLNCLLHTISAFRRIELAIGIECHFRNR